MRQEQRNKEALEFDALIEVVRHYFKIDEPTPLIVRQIKQYKHEYGFTNAGIRKTIDYCYRLADPPRLPMLDAGIALVPYYYQEAKDFYRRRHEVKVQVGTSDPNDFNQERTVVIQASDRTLPKRQSHMIDIEALGVDDEEE